MRRPSHKQLGKRNRMIVDLPTDVQMAIRVRAVKNGETNGDTVCRAVQATFPEEYREACEALEKLEEKP